MKDWKDFEPSTTHKKWDNWAYKTRRIAQPLVNYASATVFALATFVQVTGTIA